MTSLQEALRYVHRPPPDAALATAGRRPPPRPAAACLRGAAGASPEPAPVTAARATDGGAGALGRGWPGGSAFVRSLPFALTACAATGEPRDPRRSGEAAPDGASGAGGCGFRQDRGGGLCRVDRGAGRIPGGHDGADRTAGGAALPQFQRVAGPTGGQRRVACREKPGPGAVARLAGDPGRARRRWPSAPTLCSSRRSSSRAWDWSSSTNSTASACISAWRCATRDARGNSVPINWS